MRIQLRTDVTVQEVGDELLVLHRATNQLHHLNATASWIFRQLDSQSTWQSIVAGMVETFDVDATAAERDALNLLDQLRSSGLIAIDPEQAGLVADAGFWSLMPSPIS